MESEFPSESVRLVKCCACNCDSSVMKRSFSVTSLRSVKRKHDAFEEANLFTIPGLDVPQIARVDMGNECMALRETVTSQQQTIQDLISDLEEERNASASAANEAMSMILRLQWDKAEAQMEARQFKIFAEEKMAHDQQETLALEDLFHRREQVIEALTFELEAYKHRMMSYGLIEAECDGLWNISGNSGMIENLESEFQYEIYPRLKCYPNDSQVEPDGNDETFNIEKCEFVEAPCSEDQLKDLEHRINQLEKIPKTIQPDTAMKKLTIGQSPKHDWEVSDDVPNSVIVMDKELGPSFVRDSAEFITDTKKAETPYVEEYSNSRNGIDTSEVGDDEDDKIYTSDSIHHGSSVNGVKDENAFMDNENAFMDIGGVVCIKTPRRSPKHSGGRSQEIQKLHARLRALEADRESMRQEIMSIGTEKAQMVLLKEIAQNMSYTISPAKRMSARKQSVVGISSFISIFKWIIPLIFWRGKLQRCRYMCGVSDKNAGLLLLLDRGPLVQRCGYIFRTNI